jgi:hypothetical protein
MAPILFALDIAAKFAPALLGLLKGPKAEEAAHKVFDAARAVTGKNTPTEMKEALEADPLLAQEFRLALLKHEEFKLQLYADLQRDERAAELQNIGGARKRDIEVRTASGGQNRRADWMVAMAATGLVGSIIGMVLLAYIKAQYSAAISEGVFAALLTQLANTGAYFGLSLRDAFTFEFGSSRGSREKDALLANRSE